MLREPIVQVLLVLGGWFIGVVAILIFIKGATKNDK